LCFLLVIKNAEVTASDISDICQNEKYWKCYEGNVCHSFA